MLIFINDEPVKLTCDEMTVSELIEMRNLPQGTSAVAINDRLIPRARHKSHMLHEGDRVVLISAAFGG